MPRTPRNNHLKQAIRQRMTATGENYTTARRAVLSEQAHVEGPASAAHRLRCVDCGHVGSRTFTRQADGELHDVLAGENGVRPRDCVCDCGSQNLELVDADARRDFWVAVLDPATNAGHGVTVSALDVQEAIALAAPHVHPGEVVNAVRLAGDDQPPADGRTWWLYNRVDALEARALELAGERVTVTVASGERRTGVLSFRSPIITLDLGHGTSSMNVAMAARIDLAPADDGELDRDGRPAGTKVTGERRQQRTIDGHAVTETIITWNDTEQISVDYQAGDVELWADPDTCTSFDAPLPDEELRRLMVSYGVLEPAASDPVHVTVRPDAEVKVTRALTEHIDVSYDSADEPVAFRVSGPSVHQALGLYNDWQTLPAHARPPLDVMLHPAGAERIVIDDDCRDDLLDGQVCDLDTDSGTRVTVDGAALTPRAQDQLGVYEPAVVVVDARVYRIVVH